MVLLGKWGGRENSLMGPRHFSPGLTQNLSLQNGKKTKWGEFDGEMTKLPMYIAHGQSLVGYFFFPYGFLGVNTTSSFFSFDFLGLALCVCVCVCFFFFFFCLFN